MANAGTEFEQQVMKSMPKWDHIWAWKLPSSIYAPGSEDGLPEQEFTHKRNRHGSFIEIESNKKSPVRFTPKMPFDIQVIWWQPHIELRGLALECKSTKSDRLPFSSVKTHQVAGLAKARNAGMFAGVLWESRANIDHPPFFIPIAEWLKMSQLAAGSLAFSVAKYMSINGTLQTLPIHVGRGRNHRYFRMGDFLERLGQ